MSKTTPVASPSPPQQTASRHQSPQAKHNSSDLTLHRKTSELICDSPTDFQSLAAKSTDAYQDDEPFTANRKENCFLLFSKQMSIELMQDFVICRHQSTTYRVFDLNDIQ